jgi:hypothetical protein
VLFVSPADHVIRPEEAFVDFLERAASIAAGERCPEDESELISGKSGQTFNRLRQKHQRPFERTGACFWKRDPSQARQTISSASMKPVPVKVTPGILFRT